MGTEGSGKKRYSKKLTLKRNPQKDVQIHGNVLTDVRHIGKRADILVVAARTAPGATSPSFYMLDKPGTPKPWDGAISSLAPFQSRTALAPVVSVPIWNNPLDIVGDVQVYLGYRLNDGTIVYSLEEVIEITLTEKIAQEMQEMQETQKCFLRGVFCIFSVFSVFSIFCSSF